VLIKSLGVDSESTDIIKSIGAVLNALERTKIQEAFKDAGAAFWSHTGD